ALQPNIQTQLWDIISDPPAQDKYRTIKNAILSRFSDSRQTQLIKLLRDMTLGDKKPSQLLREMRELAKGSINGDALHQLWKERLPAWIRPYLLVSPHINDLNGLADLADRLVLSMGNSSVYAVHNKEHSTSTSQSHLEQQISDLKLSMKSLQQDISNIQLQLQQQLLLINNLSQRKSRADQGYGRSHHPRKPGKLVPLSTVEAVGDSESNLPPQELRLHVYDRNTNKKFLIDSGSIVSIIPASHVNDKLNKHPLTLYAANASAISTYG
ncbi:GSCOCG00012748001-RA-CDS, partial [Cotesia congregata]